MSERLRQRVEILEANLAAVREWAEQHRHRWPGTEVESCAKEVLAILDRSDTDED